MEAVGLAISAAGLAALFDACLRGFDLVERGKDFSRDHAILLTRFDAQRAMLVIWGDAVGLSSTNDFSHSKCLSDPHLRTMIKAHLECISMIFEDASQLNLKYGLKPVHKGPDPQMSATSNGSPLRSYLAWFQKKTSYRRKATWVMRDLKKFESMLDSLSKLISELRDLTLSIADLQRQREVFMDQISQCTDVDELEIVEEALSAEDPVLSSAASERRIALTEAAVTVRSIPISGSDIVKDEDMDTHADSDLDAQAAVTHAALGDLQGEIEFEDQQIPLEITKLYGHQNNLSKIQEEDEQQIRNLLVRYTKGDLEIKRPSSLNTLCSRQVLRQLRRFQSKACETPFISIGLAGRESQLDRLIGRIQAPPNTPYEGGVFTILMVIPRDYPFRPPTCRFLTPVYHPNIDQGGNICLDILTPEGWTPSWDLEQLLTALCSLLGSPNCEDGDALVPEIAQQYITDRYTYNAQARLYTQRFAAQGDSFFVNADAALVALSNPKVSLSNSQSSSTTINLSTRGCSFQSLESSSSGEGTGNTGVGSKSPDPTLRVLADIATEHSLDWGYIIYFGRRAALYILLTYIVFGLTSTFIYPSTRDIGSRIRESLRPWLEVWLTKN